MTPKERIIAAIGHQEPDRVPMVLWGSYYTLNDETYFNVLNYLNMGDPLPPFRRYMSRNSNYYDDRILDYLDTDARYIWSGFTDLGGGRMDENGVLSLRGEARGGLEREQTIRWTNENERVVTSVIVRPDGARAKMYEITYRRKAK